MFSGWFEGESSSAADSWLPDDGSAVLEKRVTVLRLHVEELNRQAAAREQLLKAAQRKLKELEKQRTAAAPQEKRLFSKLEQQAAELKLAKEARVASEARAADLAAQLERVVSAASVEAEKPGQKLLLQVTTEQLEATQTALQQAHETASDAARRVQAAEKQAAAAAAEQAKAEQANTLTLKKLNTLLEKSAAASLLQLPPPSKGHDLAEQHHILQLNFRHLQAELKRKSIAAEGLLEEREGLKEQLLTRMPAQQEAHRRARAEHAKQLQEAEGKSEVLREQLTRHIEALEGIRKSGIAKDDEEEQVKRQKAVDLAVSSKVAAAVRGGALRGSLQRANARLERSEAVCEELRRSLAASEDRVLEQAATLAREREGREESEGALALSEERCRELEADMTMVRNELAERSVELEGVTERYAVAEAAEAAARVEVKRLEEEREVASSAAAEASASAASASAREVSAQAEVTAAKAAREELLAENEQAMAQLKAAQSAQRSAQAAAADAVKSHQNEKLRLREQLEAAAERERSISEQLTREQHIRQAAVEQLNELRRGQAPVAAGDLEQRLQRAREMVAAARSESANLKLQVESMQQARSASGKREMELEGMLREAEERAASVSEQLQGATTHHAEQRAASRNQQAQLHAQTAEREREVSARAASLEGEASRLREQMRSQEAASQRQLNDLQQQLTTARQAATRAQQQAAQAQSQAARAAAKAAQQAPILLSPPPPATPSTPSSSPFVVPNSGGGGGEQNADLAERLRAQQALASKRESVAIELRQLAESYKAKAERLGQQLVEEREKAIAQGELWKHQLQTVRMRGRADKERLRTLEIRIRQSGLPSEALGDINNGGEGFPRGGGGPSIHRQEGKG